MEFFSGISAAELQAEMLDDDELEACYDSDENKQALYDGLYYSEERGDWVARFVPTEPAKTSLTRSEGTYVEVLELARILHDCRIKPSQCFKALTAFDARIDRSLCNLRLIDPNPPFGPSP